MVDFEYIKGILINYISHIIIFFAGIFYGWLRNNIYIIQVLRRKVKLFLFQKKYVIVWNDHSVQTSEKICSELEKENPSYLYRPIDKPRDLFYFPIGERYVQAIILIVTDVTKFSEIPEERDRIQYKLLQHLKDRGTLVGTHDIIYRRVRNDALQKIFGCQLNNFKRVDKPIDAVKVKEFEDHPLLRDLPENLSFDDGEVCWGEWVPDAKILIETKRGFNNRKKIPMLVTRKVSYNGLAIWMNSGDKFVGIAKSISEPEKSLLKILSNSIKYNEEIKKYNK